MFIILKYGLLTLLIQWPVVCSQGADMSLSTISTTLPSRRSLFRTLSCSSSSLASAAASASCCCWSCSASPCGRVSWARLSTPRLWASTSSSVAPSLSSAASSGPRFDMTTFALARPKVGSRTYRRTSACTSALRKLPWILDAPRGGCAGMISMPNTLPPGLVLLTAT